MLESLGLTNYESQTFEILLSRKYTAKEIVKLTRVPSGKIYTVLKSLLKNNLISQSQDRPKFYFIENPAKSLQKLISIKQKETDLIVSNARSLINESYKIKKMTSPFFQLGTTTEDNKKVQLRSFREANEEICQIINVHHKPKSNRKAKTIWEKEIGNAIKRGIKIRSIYPKNAPLPFILEKLPSDKFVVRRMDLDFIRCDIIDEKKILLKLVHSDPLNFGGVIFIEDETFAKNLKKVFEQFWEESLLE